MKWYQDEELWETFYHCMFDQDSFDLAVEQCSQILNLIEGSVNTALDLACGPGRHIIGFAKLGLDVTGVDLSGFLLNKAINKIDEMSLQARFFHADFLKFEPTRQYDLITNMFTSFGYYENPDDNQKLLNKTFKWLNSDGSLLIDVFGKEQVARSLEPVHLTEYENGDLRIERPLLTENMSIFSNEWILIKGDKVFRRNYQHYVYSAVELENMLKLAGFQNIRICGSLTGDDYDLEAKRLIVIAKKQ